MVNTLLGIWVELLDAFGFVAAVFLVIYAGGLLLLMLSVAIVVLRTWAQWIRRWPIRRHLRLIQREREARERFDRIVQANYRGGDHAA